MIILNILGFLLCMSPCLVGSYFILKMKNGAPQWLKIIMVILVNLVGLLVLGGMWANEQ